MARLVALAASPRASSRSRALLDIAVERLRAQGADIQYFHLNIFPAADLLALNTESDAIAAWTDAVAAADGLLLATPVHKASFSAGLKALLDVLPERGLANKAVLTFSAGGSKRHQLAVEHGLRPILSVLKGILVSEHVYVCEEEGKRDSTGTLQWQPQVSARLDKALQQLWRQLPDYPQRIDPLKLRDSILSAGISI
jgi:FMN reductase